MSRNRVDRIMHTCKHFNGIQNDECKAGVAYNDVRDSSLPGPYRWPCLTLPVYESAATKCPLREFPTQEEAEQEDRETEALVAKVFANLAAGKCHVCEAVIERRSQHGRCAYAHPCGHRIGQTSGADHGS